VLHDHRDQRLAVVHRTLLLEDPFPDGLDDDRLNRGLLDQECLRRGHSRRAA
jgi:hypothetical protein